MHRTVDVYSHYTRVAKVHLKYMLQCKARSRRKVERGLGNYVESFPHLNIFIRTNILATSEEITVLSLGLLKILLFQILRDSVGSKTINSSLRLLQRTLQDFL